MNDDFERNELQKAPDKSAGIEFMRDQVPPHSAAGSSHPVPVRIAQDHCEQAPEPSTGSNCVPLGLENRRNLPISIEAARNEYERELGLRKRVPDKSFKFKERESDFDAWILETTESVIQELHENGDTHWRLTSEYDGHIEVLRVKWDLLIDKLKDHTAMLEHELKNSSAGIHQLYCYHNLLSYANDSIESVQDVKDLDSRIHDSVATTSDERRKKMKRGNISQERRGRWTQKKGKGRMHGERWVL